MNIFGMIFSFSIPGVIVGALLSASLLHRRMTTKMIAKQTPRHWETPWYDLKVGE